MDDLDAALAAHQFGDEPQEWPADADGYPVDADTGEIIVAPGAGIAVDAAIAMLGQLIPRVGETLAGLASLPVERASPAEWDDLVTLHAMLDGLMSMIAHRRDAIDLNFRRGMVELNARELMLPGDRKVVYEPPAARIEVRADDLRAALAPFVPKGALTKKELDDALPVTVTVKADNRRLNAIASKRGEEIRGVIEEHRTRVEPSPLNGKVRFPAR